MQTTKATQLGLSLQLRTPIPYTNGLSIQPPLLLFVKCQGFRIFFNCRMQMFVSPKSMTDRRFCEELQSDNNLPCFSTTVMERIAIDGMPYSEDIARSGPIQSNS